MQRISKNLIVDDFTGLPGEELIRQGILDSAIGKESVFSLLVAVGYPRLHGLGVEIPGIETFLDSPEHHLYRLLFDETPRESYSRYNAFIRRLVSFERSLEGLQWRRRRNRMGLSGNSKKML